MADVFAADGFGLGRKLDHGVAGVFAADSFGLGDSLCGFRAVLAPLRGAFVYGIRPVGPVKMVHPCPNFT
ncbi:hypothetical protein [Erwinia sp. S38]|uniref:hypothetical protein n=1 Tax=Erwinia sp. S38 TaxID=2769338 RepID=UPI001D94E63B|nr:hypothetical protein [Erwinia sp. S38]MBK0001096.1 hypothetical protein [Erwinia sp. S38]